MRPCLQLNADGSPMRIVTWEHAVELLLDQKVIAVECYPGALVRSEHLAVPWPAVIMLRRYKTIRGRVRFSSKNVVLRDAGTCMYCGLSPRTRDGRIDRQELTLDHVIPRAQAQSGAVYLPWSKKWVNVTCWENSLTACRACNSRKEDRRPDQAGMTMRALPRVPSQSDVLRMSLSRHSHVPPEWAAYLPADRPPQVAEPTRGR